MRLESETFTLAALSIAFACSYFTDLLGLSIELGAFSAGLAFASLIPEIAERVERHLRGLKDSLAALFFASIGLVINGRFLLDNLAAILSVATFLFVLKTLTAYLPLRLIAARGLPAAGLTAIRVAAITAHVGEFGFVLAAKGTKLGVLSRHVYLLLVGANAMSLCLTPWLFRGLNWILPRPEEVQFF
jgi:CPA2 family monovalent cation:H+ antiporter-2